MTFDPLARLTLWALFCKERNISGILEYLLLDLDAKHSRKLFLMFPTHILVLRRDVSGVFHLMNGKRVLRCEILGARILSIYSWCTVA